MNPHRPSAEFRAWIRRHLDPLESAGSAGPAASDFDLDPGHVGETAPAALTPAAVLIALVEHDTGTTVILTRRSDTLRRHTGQVALPGGRCDPGETVWATALREAQEEIGLQPEHVELAGLSTPYRTGTGYSVTPVVGFVRPGFTLEANPDEVADIFETPFGFLMDLANHEAREGRTSAGETRRFYAITWENQLIWGATAGILRALYDRLYGAAVA